MDPGATATLVANVVPADASNTAIIWSTSNADVATVDQTGKVTAVSGGTATITVTTKDGDHTATCTINVNTKVTGVSLNKTSHSFTSLNASTTLTATVTPADATNQIHSFK